MATDPAFVWSPAATYTLIDVSESIENQRSHQGDEITAMTNPLSPKQASTKNPPAIQARLGVVSYLNSRPLYDALSDQPQIALEPDVPSRLVDGLLNDSVDAALLPVVDYFRSRDVLEPLSDACIACDGETMTVRVFLAHSRRTYYDAPRRFGFAHVGNLGATVVARTLQTRVDS